VPIDPTERGIQENEGGARNKNTLPRAQVERGDLGKRNECRVALGEEKCQHAEQAENGTPISPWENPQLEVQNQNKKTEGETALSKDYGGKKKGDYESLARVNTPTVVRFSVP